MINTRLVFRLALLSVLATFGRSEPGSSHGEAGARIVQRGFADFSQGTLGASGANLYVSAAGRVLPALGGGRCRIADLNGDGYPDLVFVNIIHNYTHRLNAYIYWGGPERP